MFGYVLRQPLRRTKSQIRKTHRTTCICTLTFIVVFFLIPAVIFGFSASFAALLLVLECPAQQPPPNVTLPIDNDPCQWYSWLLYVAGNLVGLGTPMTGVGPKSGNVLSEILDLMISMWALSIIGTVVGLIGGLSAMSGLVDLVNSRIEHLAPSSKVSSASGHLDVEDHLKTLGTQMEALAQRVEQQMAQQQQAIDALAGSVESLCEQAKQRDATRRRVRSVRSVSFDRASVQRSEEPSEERVIVDM